MDRWVDGWTESNFESTKGNTLLHGENMMFFLVTFT